MPYNRNAELPDGVKNALPAEAQTIWRKAFNNALEEYGDEETAAKVAWAAVKRKYKKVGDQWVLKEGVDASTLLERVARRSDISDADRKRAVDEYGDVPFADETNKKYPIDTEEHIRAAWNYINKPDNAEKYSAADLKAIKARIIAAWKKKIDKTGPPSVQEEALPRSVLISHSGPLTVLTEEENGESKGFRVRGVALVDDVVSANGYYYSRQANDAILEETSRYLQRGGKVTVYSRHEKARYGLPVGKVDRLERVGNKIFFEARIADTTEGRDVQVLITEGVLGPTSIRSGDFETKPMRINGRQVMAVTRAILHGIDLVEHASIAGAGISDILTEGAVIEEVKTDMDWEELSFEELKANRPDLLEEYDVAKYRGVNDKIGKLQAELEEERARNKALEQEHIAAIEAAKAPLVEQVQKLTAELEKNKLNEAIANAVKGKAHVELLEAALRNGMVFAGARVEPCAKADDVTEERVKAAEALVEALKKSLLVEGSLAGEDSFRGDVCDGPSTPLTDVQVAIMNMSA